MPSPDLSYCVEGTPIPTPYPLGALGASAVGQLPVVLWGPSDAPGYTLVIGNSAKKNKTIHFHKTVCICVTII